MVKIKQEKNIITNFFLICFSFLLTFLIGELVIRKIDGFSILKLQLERSEIRKNNHGSLSSDRIDGFSHFKKLEKWYFREPEKIFFREKIDKFLAERYKHHPGKELVSIYQWNYYYLLNKICKNDQNFNGLTDLFTFKSEKETIHPRFRFLQDTTDPSRLVTNSFGWRGKHIPLNKGKNTVRMAFVGASTTVSAHASPFSYPEYVEKWLNIWAESKKMNLHFECINAGRSGINSNDIAAIVEQEILPVEPDLVVYYEGSNQFWPASFITWPNGRMPPKPKLTFTKRLFEDYSAIVRRFFSLTIKFYSGHGGEPKKPSYTVNWPKELDEYDPDLKSPLLPLNLPIVLEDLDHIRANLDASGSELIVASFVWFAYQGMVLELPKHEGIYRYLNKTFWPFTYSHIRRMADFQNRVFEKFAKQNGLNFIDIAKYFPQDPNLHSDAIHMTSEGIKIRAWIVFNLLVPILEKKISENQIPRPDRINLSEHPAFKGDPRNLTKLNDIQKDCLKTDK